MKRPALPNVYIVVRLDGRGFTKLTKEVYKFEAPFDVVFRDYMVETVKHLMQCGFRVAYGYTESDEISLLFHLDDNAFSCKDRKLLSILAGEASARFSLFLGGVGCFDARISQLPSRNLVADYFCWRNEDAHRNALNSHCYWMLRKQGQDKKQATHFLSKMSVGDKNELLFQNGINFNDLPSRQKRGVGVYWQEYEKTGLDPLSGKHTITK